VIPGGTGRLVAVPDLTTAGLGVHPDAEALVYERVAVPHPVPGRLWQGQLSPAEVVIRLPDAYSWNGKLLVGATPAVRSAWALDLWVGDVALARGYAWASSDKGTPGLVLRQSRPPANRSMAEWESVHVQLAEMAASMVRKEYGRPPDRIYVAGLSNGGLVARLMMERHPDLFDGGVDGEGVLWQPDGHHLLRTLPVWLTQFDRMAASAPRTLAHEEGMRAMAAAGLTAEGQDLWPIYRREYWALTLWLYGAALDPWWEPFQAPWQDRWRDEAAQLAAYPAERRRTVMAERLAPLELSGRLTRPLMTVAGSADCLIPFAHHAGAYAQLVEDAGAAAWHRWYEIGGATHVDGLLPRPWGGLKPLQPFFLAALLALEAWVEEGVPPPPSGRYSQLGEWAQGVRLDELSWLWPHFVRWEHEKARRMIQPDGPRGQGGR